MIDVSAELPAFTGNITFNAQHSPMGAFLSFACGHFNTRGGLAAQAGRPGSHDIFVGVKDGSRYEPAPLKCLPFYSRLVGGGAGAGDFSAEQPGPSEQHVAPDVIPYTRDQIRRRYGWATDRWETDDLAFAIYTPFGEIPDPAKAGPAALRHALLPAVVAELEVDNRRGTRPKTACFAMNFNEPGARPLESGGPARRGFALRRDMGVLGEILIADRGSGQEAEAPALFCRWSPAQGLSDPVPHQLGSCPGLVMEVPAGQRRILRLALGCYLEGAVTTGLEGRYLYTRYFTGLDDVLNAALDRGDPQPACTELDRQLLDSGLSAEQQFLIAHATRSYYGSTELLEVGGHPFWVVNEGEYCMMNTLDLSVDQMFWELDQNPWVVRNLLESFVRYYSYVDGLKTGKGTDGAIAGGLSFTHDMGAHNNFSPRGHSSYELPDLDAVCFSYMTAEQLCNWVLIAATYVTKTGDMNWARQNSYVLLGCLESLVNRGGTSACPEYDSTRCGTGAEITTYDSLDHSLAQTRNSLYMGVKFWASFIGLRILFERLGAAWSPQRARAAAKAEEAARTLVRRAGHDGVIPAIFERDSSGYQARILPACEGLLYPLMWGLDVAAEAPALCATLRQHTVALLTDPQKRNFFPDGGVRLSSTSHNSWMSKIALFQVVAREVFGLYDDPRIAALFEAADRAHVAWQTDGSGYWACSDQFVDGVAKASRWYPRVITTALWLGAAARQGTPRTRTAAVARAPQTQD